MFSKAISPMILVGFTLLCPLRAQTAPQAPAGGNPSKEKTDDTVQPNRFWQANVNGGQYMVALDRITSISRHRYLIDGGIVVDEVTVDTVGQSLVRFYYMSPLTDTMKGSGTGAAAARIVDRGRELVDRAGEITGSNAHNMVVKKFPETTHARSIEYRIDSEGELSALHGSARTAWETGRGRKFTIK
jgi:predicted amino acid dehydrogenase